MLAARGEVVASRNLLFHALGSGVGHPGLLRSFVTGCGKSGAHRLVFDSWREVLRRWPAMVDRAYVANDIVCLMLDAEEVALADSLIAEMREVGEGVLPAVGCRRLMQAWLREGEPAKALAVFHVLRAAFASNRRHSRRGRAAPQEEEGVGDASAPEDADDPVAYAGDLRTQPLGSGHYWAALDAAAALEAREELASLPAWLEEDGILMDDRFHTRLIRLQARLLGLEVARAHVRRLAAARQIGRAHV